MDLKLEFTLFLFKNCIFLLKYNLIQKKKKKAIKKILLSMEQLAQVSMVLQIHRSSDLEPVWLSWTLGFVLF